MDRRPSYEELAELVVRQAERIEQLEAEVADFEAAAGAELDQLLAPAVVGLAVRQAGAEVTAPQDGP